MKMINLNNLPLKHSKIKKEVEEEISKVISKSEFVGGSEVKEFEKNFANFCEKDFCVGTNSGTSSLFAALKCLRINQGDEVLVPINTFVATAFSVEMCNAKPVFVEVNEEGLMNPKKIEEKITSKTKVIIPVHLYGNVCDMKRIFEIAEKNNLRVIEDCAQAHGSTYEGRKVPVGEIGCFSFMPAKTLGAFGDSGAVVTSNQKISEDVAKFVNQGRDTKYTHSMKGFNFRMGNLQAAVLNVKLKYLNDWIAQKEKNAEIYDKEFKEFVKIVNPKKKESNSYYQYVIQTKKRDELRKYLENKGIQTGVHYPLPLHLQPVFSYLGYKQGDYPVGERLANEVLSIPVHEDLSEDEKKHIVKSIRSFFEKTIF